MRKEDYHPDWKAISYQIRIVRAGGKCESCGVENLSIIRRSDDGSFTYATEEDESQVKMLREVQGWRLWRALQYLGLTKVILTTAHLDRDRSNNHDDNLMAKCQRCHLGYDMPQHVRNRKYGRYHDRDHQLIIPLTNESQ